MSSKPASEVVDACARRGKFVTQYVRRVSARCTSENDRNQVVGGALIAYVAFFEAQLEELFVGLMIEKYQHPLAQVKPIVVPANRASAKLIINGGRSYVDWLPYEQHLKKRAQGFFRQGAPFAGLDAVSRKSLERASILRNSLAHASDHSQRQFEREFLEGHQIPRSQHRPAPYLRGQHSLGRTRFDVTVTELVLVMQKLTS